MLSLILLQQIAQLFIIIFLGWAIVKAGILKSEDSRVPVSYTHLTLPTNREV